MSVFCEDCEQASTDASPGNISTFNGIGRKFYGDADECSKCGSVVKTLWFVLVYIPILPLGSYRFKVQEGGTFSSTFRARGTQMNWPQVFRTWLIGWALGVIAFLIIWQMNKK